MNSNMITINIPGKNLIEHELNINGLLSDIRSELTKVISFPFIFLDKEKNEILKEKELSTKLEDILDGKNLFLKQELIKGEMLGNLIEKKNGLDIYLYPQINLSKEEKDISTNIMVVGEAGVGKSFWLHNLLNYIQNIKFEENYRYYLFDEKNLEEQYEKQYGEMLPNYLIVEKPYLYNIKATNVYQNPIRILDTQGYGDTRGLAYDIAKFQEIKNLLVKLGVNSFNAICLFFKVHTTRIKMLNFIYGQLVSLFGKDIINNIIVIFTFDEDYKEIEVLKALKCKNGDFYKSIGDIDNIPYFTFNNIVYFNDKRESVKKMFEKNNTNFSKFFNTVSSFKRISLAKNNKKMK